MASLLSQLDANARLMMYLAGELPAEDAAEMDRLLAADAGLRGQLEELRLMQSQFGVLMAGDDGLAAADEASVHRTMRVIRQRNLELAARPLVQAAPRESHRRRSVLQYSLVAVAASAALFVGLWGLGVLNGSSKPVGPNRALLEVGYNGVDPNLVVRDDTSMRLDEAAEHIRALRPNEDEDSVLLML